MHFVVHALDKPDALPRRKVALAAHRAYLDKAPAEHGVCVLLSGPLTSDDGERMTGSFFLLDAPNRAAIEAMFEGDQIAQADVWQVRTVTAFALRQNSMDGTE
ncbi:MAG: YciI family protein [Pseudomonadota bacterium]